MTTFATLYKIAAKKKVRQWSIQVELLENGFAKMTTTWGELDGKKVVNEELFQQGKAGRTAHEQALLEARRKWTDKKEKEQFGEVLPGETLVEEVVAAVAPAPAQKFRPMLAQTWKPEKSKLKFPVYAQRKYDGIRCLAYLTEDGQVRLESRTGGEFYMFDVLKSQILHILRPNLILDGELFTANLPFEEISGLVRKKTITAEDELKRNQIEYHIYDLYDRNAPDASFSIRRKILEDLSWNAVAGEASLLCRVPTILIHDPAEIMQWHNIFIEERFEGIMLRTPEGPYQVNFRSAHLLKYKTFMEEDFRICGFHQGVAGEAGCIIWECETDAGGKFAVRPRGTHEERKLLLQTEEARAETGTGPTNIGRYLSVIFQEYSADGIPRFPVGKAIRIDCERG